MKRLFLSLIAIIPLICFAQTSDLNLRDVVPNDPSVRIGTLDNGTKYYIRGNAKDAKRADFYIIYDIGAVQEEDNQNGLAHFLEHMAFNGSKNFPDNTLIDYLQSVGVRFGENLNASTGQERTMYMVTNVPITREGIIDSALLVMHDWSGFINLNPKDIDEERGVIREEWRQGYSAGRRLYDKQLPIIYNNSIYSKRNVIGNEEVLKSFTYEDLKSFYRKWYRPDTHAFIIVGDFDVDQMEAKLKKTMADIKPADVKTPKAKVEIADNNEPLIGIFTDPEMTGTIGQFIFRHKPIQEQYINTIEAAKYNTLTSLVSSMMNERFRDITNKENAPIMNAGVGYMNYAEPFDIFSLSVQIKDNQISTAMEAAYTEMLRMQQGGFTASELERAKANMLNSVESQYKSRNDRRNGEFVYSYMNNFIKNTPYPTPEYNLELTKKLLESITLKDISYMAENLVRYKNSSIIITAPASAAVPTQSDLMAMVNRVQESDIKPFVEDLKATTLLDPSKIVAGKVTKEEKGVFGSTIWTLSNGVKVVLKPTDFRADDVLMTGVQLGGLSTIANLDDLASIKVMYPNFAGSSGLGTLTQTELQKILTGKRASAYVSFSERDVKINGGSSVKDIETMLQLAYLRITAPRFEQSDLNMVKDKIKAQIPNMVKTPGYIMEDTYLKLIFNNDPRAMLDLISMASVDASSLERMKAIYTKQLDNANGMTFFFTGNMDLAAFKPMVEKYLGSLPSSKSKPAVGKNFDTTIKGEVKKEIKTKMEIPKVSSRVVYTGKIDKSLQERVALAAIGHILNVRYTKAIREEAGGTYGVGVSMYLEQWPQPKYTLRIEFNTDASKIDELLPIIYKEINNMVANGVSAENLTIFKEFSIKKFAENNIANGMWSSYLQNYYLWDTDNYTDYLKCVQDLSLESIKEVAKRAFTQGNIVTLVQLPE